MKTAMLLTTSYSQHSQNIKNIIVPHVQHELGKVIGVGVCVYICLWTKKFES